MRTIDFYRTEFLAYLEEKIQTKRPENLYAPITYIVRLGGKRLRPVLTLMATEVFGSGYKEGRNQWSQLPTGWSLLQLLHMSCQK